ncbi:unnamed protein product (macronuclear) [Paramecium tetraurelia]|uniref:Enkurin domain-containing protein n=1 Tax=Paramecium tetraurelia TaxID=5888 RepID=A0C4N2_PARTE|nr:uncharacterized protein GSPATT00006248001 [Paramecium tetraurelia]CAK65749.1 unnamed protein product [Paramecium tetraurelia]|eukprot:XP_001433146.1 hypothetical protein (macronuclear) [Paramecium tetraurelia strain d4-2]
MQKTSLVNFLHNGSNFHPFGDKPEKLNSTEGRFVPFIFERNQVGKLANAELYHLNSNQKRIKQTTSEQTHSLIADTIIKSKLHTEQDSPKYDPVTKYMTLIPTHHQIDDLQKTIDIKSYTLNHTSVERGQQMRKQPKGLNHKHQLIGRSTKTLTSQIPAIGIYDPLPLNRHLPNIQIKSKSIQKLPEVWERNTQVTTPKINIKNSESEMMFAKQIAQINREIDSQMKRNPNQKFSQLQFDIHENMNLEEAEQMRNRMKQYFQSVKDSLAKIKNLINVKR